MLWVPLLEGLWLVKPLMGLSGMGGCCFSVVVVGW